MKKPKTNLIFVFSINLLLLCLIFIYNFHFKFNNDTNFKTTPIPKKNFAINYPSVSPYINELKKEEVLAWKNASKKKFISQQTFSNLANKDITKANSKNHIHISTYDGSNQCTHPKVLYTQRLWNGYKYWMCYTPYPNSNDDYENPSIGVSNDGITWLIPKHLKNPVVSPPKDVNTGGHYSDPHLVLNSKNNELELWYRYNKCCPEKSIPDNSIDFIYKTSSKDGVYWSEPKRSLLPSITCYSPAIEYDGEIYKVWYVSRDPFLRIVYAESSDGIAWQNKKFVNLPLKNDCYPWHIDILKTDLGYEMLISYFYNELKNNSLCYSMSKDGINFSNAIDIVIPCKDLNAWDNDMIYRSSLVKENNLYKIYYSARDINNKWHIGLCQGTDITNLKGLN